MGKAGSTCWKNIKKAFPEKKNWSGIEQIFDELEGRYSRYFTQDPSADFGSEQFRKEAMEYLSGLVKERIRAQQEYLNNQAVKTRISNFIEKEFGTDAESAFRGLMDQITRGEAALTDGGNLTAEGLRNYRKTSWTGSFMAAVKRADAVEDLKSPEFQELVARELGELRPDGSPGVTKNGKAAQVAKAMRAVYQDILAAKRDSGIQVGEIFGYIMRQSHNSPVIRADGFEKWAEFLAPLIDENRTFGVLGSAGDKTGAFREEILHGIYDDIVKGKDADFLPYTGGGKNLSTRNSFKRQIHFKDAESFMRYNTQYGTKNLFQAFQQAIHLGARDSALVQKLGSNPEAMLQHFAKKYDLDPGQTKQLGIQYDTFLGKNSRAPQTMKGKIAQGALSWTNMTKLGNAIFANLGGDIATTGAVVRSATGENLLTATLKAGKEFVELLPPGKTRQMWAERMNIAFDANFENHWRSLGSGDEYKPGLISKFSEWFFTLNGMHAQTEASHTSIKLLFGFDLHDQSHLSFEELNPHRQANLARYDISPENWEMIRKAGGEFKGHQLIDPQTIREADPALFGGEKLQRQLAEKVGVMLDDLTGVANPQAGDRMRAFMYQGYSIDEPIGIALRFIWQFRSFGATMVSVNKRMAMSIPGVEPRNFWAAMGTRQGITNMSTMLMSGAALGYLGTSLLDLAKGNTPADPTKPKTFMDAMVRSGVGGLYSDFILGEYDRYKGRPLESFFVGPFLTDVAKTGEIAKKAVKGDAKAGQMLNHAISLVPYNNLWWLRAGVNRLFLDDLQEMAHPGFKANQRKLLRERGQKSLFE